MAWHVFYYQDKDGKWHRYYYSTVTHLKESRDADVE
jgi:hypothetical protein